MGTSFNAILERFVWNALGVVALTAPVMIGSVHWPAKLALTAVSVAILMAYTLLLFRRGYRMRFDGFMLLGVGVMAVMFLQLVPLGDSLLGTLSPTAMAAVEKARALGYEVPTRLSLDPIATAEMLMLAAAALALYLVCFNISYRDGSGNKLLTIVGLSGALVAAIALGQSLSGSESILWMYTPDVVVADRGPFFATFVNNNHAAAFLTFTAFVLIGIWRKAQFGKSKGIYGMLVVMTLTASCLMMSRGGILALLAGAGLLTVLSRWAAAQRRALPSVGLTVFGIALTMGCIIVFLVFFNAMVVRTEDMSLFAGVDEGTKVAAWRKAVETVKSFKIAGAGAGAFGAAFEPFNNFAAMVRFPHAENELLEPLVEFGVPLGILLIGVAAILLWRRFGFARSEAYYAEAFCGLFALWMHNLVDFNIRVPGVLLPVAITMGALSGAFARNLTKHRPWRLRIGCLKLMPIATTVYLLGVVGGTWAWQNGADAAYAAVPKSDTGGQLDDEGHHAMAAKWVALHPHDSHLYTLLAGWEHDRGEEERAFSLYHRARELCPTCPAPRLGLVRLHLDRDEPERILEIFRDMLAEIDHGRSGIFTAISNATIDERLIAESWGDDPELLGEFARHLKRKGKHGRLERLALASFKTRGYDEEMLNLLGGVYLKERELN